MFGGAWVVRDHLGAVLLHSRRAMGRNMRREDADVQGILWAIESMHSHKFKKIIFAFESIELNGVILRPKAWPSYAQQQ